MSVHHEMGVESADKSNNPKNFRRRTRSRRIGSVISRPVLAAKGANDQVVLGMIGVGNQGTGRLREFLKLADVRIGAVCDLDRSHLDRALGIVQRSCPKLRRFPSVIGAEGTRRGGDRDASTGTPFLQ